MVKSTYSLTLADRVTLLSILPETGNIATMSIIKSLHKKLEFTQEEVTDYEIKSNGNTVYWKPGSQHEIEVNLTDLELEEIDKAISEADKQKAITVHMVATIEKFTNG